MTVSLQAEVWHDYNNDLAEHTKNKLLLTFFLELLHFIMEQPLINVPRSKD